MMNKTCKGIHYMTFAQIYSLEKLTPVDQSQSHCRFELTDFTENQAVFIMITTLIFVFASDYASIQLEDIKHFEPCLIF